MSRSMNTDFEKWWRMMDNVLAGRPLQEATKEAFLAGYHKGRDETKKELKREYDDRVKKLQTTIHNSPNSKQETEFRIRLADEITDKQEEAKKEYFGGYFNDLTPAIRWIRPVKDSENVMLGDVRTMASRGGEKLVVHVLDWSLSLTEEERKEYPSPTLWWAEK